LSLLNLIHAECLTLNPTIAMFEEGSNLKPAMVHDT